MRWGSVVWLYWLPLVIPVTWGLWALLRRRRRALARLVAPSMLPLLAPPWNPAPAFRRLLLRMAALSLLVVALARPQWESIWRMSAAPASMCWWCWTPRAP